ncbi:small proline-rich protein 2F-like [Monomorium pharaonis]|uniref:small proline-rich protein 2F-like n=1 Tax=Monomorium pharaonis TaxID=307658 RepID=UPI0017472FF6|nr:small proline-rich protein 2F-like [Monomorium pharaonis]
MSYCYLIQGKCLTLQNDLPYEMQYVCELDCKPVCISPCPPCKVSCDTCEMPCPPIAECPTYSNTKSCDRQAQSYPPAQPASQCQPCSPNSETMYQGAMCQPNVQRNELNPRA